MMETVVTSPGAIAAQQAQMQAERLQNVTMTAEALQERNRALEQNLLHNSLQSQQQTQDILGAASQLVQEHQDTRASWEQAVENLKAEYQSEALKVQEWYAQKLNADRRTMDELCAKINGETRERFQTEKKEMDRMRSIGQGLEGDLRREQERGHQRQMHAQGEQNICAELRQTLHRVTHEAQQSQQQATKYSQRMQEMLLSEVTMANVVRDLQNAMRGSQNAQGMDAAAFSQEAMRIRNESQRQNSEIQMAERAACDRLNAQLLQSQTMERQSRICLLYTSPSPRDRQKSRMPSSA